MVDSLKWHVTGDPPVSSTGKANEMAPSKVYQLDNYLGNSWRVSVPKALVDEFVAKHGVVTVEWKKTRAGLLMVPSFGKVYVPHVKGKDGKFK